MQTSYQSFGKDPRS